MNRHSTRMLFVAALTLGAQLAAASMQAEEPRQSPQEPVRSVQDVARQRIDHASKQLDTALAKGLDSRDLALNPPIDDAGFVRRAYLTVVGRIPTVPEAERFLADLSNDKRARLIDALLDSPGFTSHMANFWFDLLRVKSRLRQQSGEPFAHWIRDALRNGMPYDEFVTAMVTATGYAHAEGNGATGFLLRDMNMPHDAMANTLRAFTGTRLECAQCHNHPTQAWKQREFFAMAAFYGGLQYRTELPADAQRALRELATSGEERQRAAARRALQTATIGLRGSGTGVERLPQDYAYDDLPPRSPIPAASIFGPKIKAEQKSTSAPAAASRRPARASSAQQRAAEVDSRALFAQWLTSPGNDRFTRVIANRMWQVTFGRALTEPLDDLKDDSKAVHPDVERKLQSLVIEFDFDLRQVLRVLLSTQLFSREATRCESGEPFLFQGPFEQRMSAEQLWDSLLTLQDERIDDRLQPTGARAVAAYSRQSRLVSGDPLQIDEALNRRPEAEAEAQRRLQAIADRRALDQDRQAQVRELSQKILAARRKGDRAAVETLTKERIALSLPMPMDSSAVLRDGLFRASDLEQPAASSHLLRQFGQSDRETVDAATRAASVPQALTLLNGPLGNAASTVVRRMAEAADIDARIDVAFLATLTRRPLDCERATWQQEFASRGKEATADLVWVLVNSHEFRRCP